MRNFLGYIFMSLLFFNILFLFYFYFRIVSFFYLEVFPFKYIENLFLANLIVVLVDIISLFLYKFVIRFKNNYGMYVFVGLVIGLVFSMIMFSTSKYEFSDYLAVISYFLINNVFIMYSLSFETEKMKVFEWVFFTFLE